MPHRKYQPNQLPTDDQLSVDSTSARAKVTGTFALNSKMGAHLREFAKREGTTLAEAAREMIYLGMASVPTAAHIENGRIQAYYQMKIALLTALNAHLKNWKENFERDLKISEEQVKQLLMCKCPSCGHEFQKE